MTNQEHSDNPPEKANYNPVEQGPVPPSPPQKDTVGEKGNTNADNKESISQELASEFRWVEFAQIGSNVILAVVGIIALCIYNGQLGEMRKSSKAAQDAADAAKTSAGAAQSAADTAKDTLTATKNSFIVDQRPYMVLDDHFPEFVQPPQSNQPIAVNVQTKNIGKSTAIQVVTDLMLTPVTAPSNPTHNPEQQKKDRATYIRFVESNFGKLYSSNATTRKEIAELQNISPGEDVAPTRSHFSTTKDVSISSADFPKLATGEVSLYLFGVVTYVDSYRESTYRTEFCYRYFGTNQAIWHICDSHNIIR